MKEFKYDVTEFIAPLKESDKSDWVKAVARISWNDGPSNLDIRNMNLSKDIIGKGISLTDEEADTLTDILLNEGFGSVDSIEEALDKKKCFKLELDEANTCFDDDDGPLIINVGE